MARRPVTKEIYVSHEECKLCKENCNLCKEGIMKTLKYEAELTRKTVTISVSSVGLVLSILQIILMFRGHLV